MSARGLDRLGKTVAFSAVVEIGTALLLLAAPALVVSWLLGVAADATVQVVSRCFGIALLALATACWPERGSAASAPPAVRAMLIYNALIALLLAYLATVQQMGGPLLWPAVALHAVVGLLLVATWRRQLGTKATSS